MSKELKNGILLKDLQYALSKVCKVHNTKLVMIYNEQTHIITFRLEELK